MVFMTVTEHYALALVVYFIIGGQLGVGYTATNDDNSEKSKRLDLIYMLGQQLAIGYGIASFKFVDGRYLLWLVPIFSAIVGSRVGLQLGTQRGDYSVRGVIFGTYVAVPLIYHLVLT